jgi:prepilin-type N-terminal cleavage/methylation domain-containing protein
MNKEKMKNEGRNTMRINKGDKMFLFFRFSSFVSTDKGITLVELLVALTVSSIIGTSAIGLHISQQKIFAKEEALTNVRNSVRNALDITTRDVRMAGYNPTESVDFLPGVCSAKEDEIHIVMDADTNGVLDNPEKRGFQFSGDTLYRIRFSGPAGSARTPVAINIDYFEFQYFKYNGDMIACPVDSTELANIDRVRVVVVGKTEREFSNHHEQGEYPDGTPYDDRCYRCWLTRNIKLRNH